MMIKSAPITVKELIEALREIEENYGENTMVDAVGDSHMFYMEKTVDGKIPVRYEPPIMGRAARALLFVGDTNRKTLMEL